MKISKKKQDFHYFIFVGDTIIANGGSGLVAQTVAQICKLKGYNLISIVRSRGGEDNVEIVERTKKDGATMVLNEEDFGRYTYRDIVKEFPAKLALDCVGGRSTNNIASFLE